MRRSISLFIAIVQCILILAHAFVYWTWVYFEYPGGASTWRFHTTVALLSFSFIAASLLAWRSHNILVRLFYTLAAVWLGFLNFFFLAAIASWLIYGVVFVLHLPVSRAHLASSIYIAAVLAGLYALVNASWTRLTRITVKLPNIPDSWRGRVAALVSDTHLGHIRNTRFLQRVVSLMRAAAPDVIFISGDMFDGTKINAEDAARPLAGLKPPMGTYFVTGNHEEFTGHEKYVRAIQKTGVRVLDAEKIDLDGLQIVGVHYVDAANPARFREILRRAAIDPARASILLSHAPDRLNIPEEEGISLQLSGHTHGGQMPPFSWLTRRAYGKYIHGLQRFGRMLVFVNWGAGSWGPPMRLGTHSEIVLIRFE